MSGILGVLNIDVPSRREGLNRYPWNCGIKVLNLLETPVICQTVVYVSKTRDQNK